MVIQGSAVFFSFYCKKFLKYFAAITFLIAIANNVINFRNTLYNNVLGEVVFGFFMG